MPGFFVFFETHAFGLAVGIEAEHGGGHAGFDGEDVPRVERDDVGYQEVDVAGGVHGASFADGVGGTGFVGVGAETVGGLDLHAEKAAAVVEDEVVALGVSPGLGDAKPSWLALWRKAASLRSPARLVLDLGFMFGYSGLLCCGISRIGSVMESKSPLLAKSARSGAPLALQMEAKCEKARR